MESEELSTSETVETSATTRDEVVRKVGTREDGSAPRDDEKVSTRDVGEAFICLKIRSSRVWIGVDHASSGSSIAKLGDEVA